MIKRDASHRKFYLLGLGNQVANDLKNVGSNCLKKTFIAFHKVFVHYIIEISLSNHSFPHSHTSEVKTCDGLRQVRPGLNTLHICVHFMNLQ
jgi:hypothetical protein